jgi:hypothetical protein
MKENKIQDSSKVNKQAETNIALIYIPARPGIFHTSGAIDFLTAVVTRINFYITPG